MSTQYPLSDFLIKLSDPRILARFRENPEAVFQEENLSDSDRAAIQSGIGELVRLRAASEQEGGGVSSSDASVPDEASEFAIDLELLPDADMRGDFAASLAEAGEPKRIPIAEIPETPEIPEIPETPEIPEIPETPEIPEIPETPEIPEIPETPEIPEIPETPEIPEIPETPEIPEIPETPEIPEIPETPEIPEIPETPEIPEIPETPEIPEVPETPEIPEVPETPEVQENTRGRRGKVKA